MTIVVDPSAESAYLAASKQMEVSATATPPESTAPPSLSEKNRQIAEIRASVAAERRRKNLPKSAAAGARLMREIGKKRDQLLSLVDEADAADPMRAVLRDLAAAMFRDPEFEVPGEWFFSYSWFRSGVLQIVGEHKAGCQIVVRTGAKTPFKDVLDGPSISWSRTS